MFNNFDEYLEIVKIRSIQKGLELPDIKHIHDCFEMEIYPNKVFSCITLK